MAPASSQAQGLPVDARSDLYALGIVLYELVTGRGPYQTAHPLAVLQQHDAAPLTPPSLVGPDLPPEIEQVILRALAKRPEERYQSAEQFKGAMEEAREAKGSVRSVAVEDARPPP